MKRIAVLLCVFILSQLALAGQPELVSASATPETAAPGDTVSFVIEFKGETKDIESVVLTVREYPYDGPRVPLQPKEKESKSVWVAQGPVPYDAPLETYHLEIAAKTADGQEIISKEHKNNTWGKTGVIVLTVK
ncbi:hypothetical protein GF406_08605 [candidate division KSB1 bacterium]|nr:hypothetical protein [candidate division KSB1 bacterium]